MDSRGESVIRFEKQAEMTEQAIVMLYLELFFLINLEVMIIMMKMICSLF